MDKSIIILGASTLQLPEDLTVIDEQAFMGDHSITEVLVPDGVRTIGRNAFSGCTGLTSINLPERLLSIGEGVFDGCTGLTIKGYTDSLADRYAVEYDGIQHFEASNRGWNTEYHYKKTKINDKIKDEYCKSHNIPLIRIPYTKYDTLTIDDLILDKEVA